MSSTNIKGFYFILPIGLTDTPIPFDKFIKEDGVSYYSYNEYMALPNKQAHYTPSNTHAIISINVTSIFNLATLFPQYLSAVSPTTVIYEGINIDNWADTVQDDYLWIISHDKTLAYGYEEFKKVSPLYVVPVVIP